ncbi:uncharacterized protein [Macrobrachium rosenbergii]|uniref:uncharacterized protein n=1 Tax=Macrobrachium rosenbergii TaxID=79674 RepID=UPI0034D55E52
MSTYWDLYPPPIHHHRQKYQVARSNTSAAPDTVKLRESSLGWRIHTIFSAKANSIIERLHRLLKAYLTTRFQGGSWRKELPWDLLGLRMSPHAAFNVSPAEALYGQSLTLPADIFQQPISPTSPSDTRKALERIMPAKTTYHMAREVYVPNELHNAKYAFIWVDAQRSPPLPCLLETILSHPEKKQSLPNDSGWQN